MLKVLVWIAAIAVTVSSGMTILDHYEVYAARTEASRQLSAALAEERRLSEAKVAGELRKAEGLKVCDQPYWEYRRGLAADSVTKPRMEELKRIISDCNAKYGTDFSL